MQLHRDSARSDLPRSARVVILGAGLTGLIAARELLRAGLRDVVLLERDARPGGLLKTNREGGCALDELPHVFFTRNERAASVFRALAGRVLAHRHRLGVLWKGGWVDFPFQNNVHQLGAADRRLVLRSLLESRLAGAAPVPRNLEEYAQRELGAGITELFFRPYNEKLWQTRLDRMSYAWLASKIRLPGPEELAESILGGRPSRDVAPHAEFICPVGGIETVVDSLLREITPAAVFCGVEAERIDTRARAVRTSRGVLRYDRLISTLPLDRTVRLAGLSGRLPAARRLRCTRVFCLQYALADLNLPPYHWIYVPDPALPFYRLTRYDLINPRSVPGGRGLLVECALPGGSPAAAARGLEARATAALIKLGVLKKKDIIRVKAFDHCPAYPVPHVSHGEDVAACLAGLAAAGVVSAGRFGEWGIYNMDHSIEAGLAAAKKVLG